MNANNTETPWYNTNTLDETNTDYIVLKEAWWRVR